MRKLFIALFVSAALLLSTEALAQQFWVSNQTPCPVSVFVYVEDCLDCAHSSSWVGVPPFTGPIAVLDWSVATDWADCFASMPMTIPSFWNWSHAIVSIPGGGTVQVGNGTNCLGTFTTPLTTTDCNGNTVTIEWGVSGSGDAGVRIR